MASMSVEDAITQTANVARALLFDRDGKSKGIDHYLASLTLHTLIRPTEWFGQPDHPGIQVFEWGGASHVYDPGLAEILFSESSDPYCDRILRNAAAVILLATGGIADKRLRNYAARRLSGDIPAPAVKPARGRSADDNRWRNVCIVGYLIPPLLRKGFHSTRNEATKYADKDAQSACSIVSRALNSVGIELSEKGVEAVWGARPSSE